jgi:phosphoenolpyruvate carboxykinase (ATP)
MNYLMPQRDIFPMHCSANIHHDKEETALFFGLSGTGKTTLSADPHRRLIGDDEHGWSKDGIFNFEGGCYAKCIDLTEEREPVIMQAIKFGAVIENVVMDDYTRVPDYKDASITENTRVGYPLTHVPDATFPSIGGHPSKVVFLTCDAFGVLPPISKLTPEQAMYHFMSGYTAKLAGTEMGVTEPQAAFSTCFGAPFMPLPAVEYAHMLGDRIREHQPDVFLVNTGWSGGAYGEGSRMSLPVTRALVTAAVEGGLEDVEYETDPIFGLHVPTSAPGVSDNLLMPSKTWKTQEAYDEKATLLAGLFHENFKKFGDVPDNIKQAGPKALTAAS